jgi:SOS-response transcriptional repressor LexA
VSETDTILRVRSDWPDLGFLAGDAVLVRGQETAEKEQIVVVVADDGDVSVERYDGQARVIGLVVEMWRRV